MPMANIDSMASVVIVGATRGTGRALAGEYASRGARVIVTGRSEQNARQAAAEIEGDVRGLRLDLSRPHEIAEALNGVGEVERLALVGIQRDINTIAAYDVTRAIDLAITKVVGYLTVVSALRERFTDDAAILLFGGMAKDHPYPGSTTLTAANAAVVGQVRTLCTELAPIRVNAIHPSAIGDSPFWLDNPDALELSRAQTLTGVSGRTGDVVEGCLFLLENPFANGVNLHLDGGRRS